jgi:hypothetical protein
MDSKPIAVDVTFKMGDVTIQAERLREWANEIDKYRALLSLWLEHYDELGDGTPTVSLDELAQRTMKVLND